MTSLTTLPPSTIHILESQNFSHPLFTNLPNRKSILFNIEKRILSSCISVFPRIRNYIPLVHHSVQQPLIAQSTPFNLQNHYILTNHGAVHIRMSTPLDNFGLKKDLEGAVVLIHGCGDSGGSFTKLTEELLKKGFVVITPDMIGHGKSDGQRGYFNSIDALIEPLEAVHKWVDQQPTLKELPKGIYGNSMGGLATLYMTLIREKKLPSELRSIVAASPWLELAKPFSDRTKKAISILNIPILKRILIYRLNHNKFRFPHELERVSEDPELLHHNCGSIGLLNTVETVKNKLFELDKSSLIEKKNKVKVLISHGTDDPVTSYNASEKFSEKLGLEFQPSTSDRHSLHKYVFSRLKPLVQNTSFDSEIDTYCEGIANRFKMHFQPIEPG